MPCARSGQWKSNRHGQHEIGKHENAEDPREYFSTQVSVRKKDANLGHQAFGRATGGVGVYMNFMSLTACMDKAH